MRLSVSTKMAIGFGLAFVMLVTIGFASYRSTMGLVSTLGAVSHTHTVMEKAAMVLARVGTFEGAFRGHLLTGDAKMLARQRADAAGIPLLLADLRKITSGDPELERRLDALEPLVTEKIRWSEMVAETYRSRGADAAAALVRTGVGRRLMDRIERVTLDMTAEETALLVVRENEARAGARTALMIVVLGSLVAMTVVVASLVVLRRHLSRRERLEVSLRESESRLQAIIDNTTAVIYVRDLEGRYLLVNKRFEETVRRTRAEILGKTLVEATGIELSQEYFAHDRLVLAADKPLPFDEETVLDGEPRTFQSVRCALRDANGRPYAICGFSTDITDRKEAERAIAALNESLQVRTRELEASNREMEAFSYSVSHDLRAPLRHIAGFSDLLTRHSAAILDERGRRYVDTIAKAATQMGVLIDELLVFSRMGRSEFQSGSVHLSGLVKEIVRSLEPDTKGRRIEWTVRNLPVVRGDATMLRLAVENLLSNAVKYTRTRPDARIEVGAETKEGETVIYVRDNGVGFDPRYSGKLFGVFQRLHSASEFEGTGIGLANVRRIVTRHGGRTWAEAEVDRGATFYFSLPEYKEAA